MDRTGITALHVCLWSMITGCNPMYAYKIQLTPEHRYFVDGVEYDGVTAILRAESFMPSYIPADLDWYIVRGTIVPAIPADLDWYLERGRMIHKATELYDKGILDESTVDERIQGYLDSWKHYRTGLPPYPAETIEIRLCDPLYQFAGTLDRWDLDIKSGQPERWHIYQIAAYAHLARVNGLSITPYQTVYLQEDGSRPLVVKHNRRELMKAGETFLCALNVHRAKS